ncbi:hypothetical protein PUNSTDRAFT_144470 [Punctularia strigosozonata HHB-11173 SS5]|uniref:uncharacterized protein n=1 Tax=Punctularia strigosozonata (strain HHB-11173) TaxID=741275 RepID=UPI0004416694|nr:uncharacterized protein PUNSTDRAFT_144470 [Punctularia strigosozonata HHB-11173 SS5]EIN08011.1 hypothetical protein PUNSTDRAFT_144470 [Punctularia strigosozonata HHB-11173 SS5]
MVYSPQRPLYASSSSSLSHEDEKFSSPVSPLGSPLLDNPTEGSHKIKYQPRQQWDWAIETNHRPVDVTLTLPHYRARNQPLNHRMRMYVGSSTGHIKARVSRQPITHTPFYLEIQADSSDVTVWLPSDFRGRIRYPRGSRLAFSPGFTNQIMQRVRFARPRDSCIEALEDGADELIVITTGTISLRMWDVSTGAPECKTRETWRRVFGCGRKAPETPIDWDFLLDG